MFRFEQNVGIEKMKTEIRFSKKDCKRVYKIKESIKAFRENAREYLKDAEILFMKNRYNTCVTCCQLGLEEFGIAFKLMDLLWYSEGQKEEYRKFLTEIKDNYKKHIYRIKGVADFRFRYNQQKDFGVKNSQNIFINFGKNLHMFNMIKRQGALLLQKK